MEQSASGGPTAALQPFSYQQENRERHCEGGQTKIPFRLFNAIIYFRFSKSVNLMAHTT